MRAAFLLTLVAAALALPAHASAHAVLEGTSPKRDAHTARAPGTVAFSFSEPVEASFGAVKVYDSQGHEIQRGAPYRPGGDSTRLAVRLADDVGDGVVTATYRVVSADSHPVSGGFTFTVGKRGGPAANSLSELIDNSGAGPVTATAFGVARALGYLAIALVAGGAFFAFAVWRPAAGDRWPEAEWPFTRRLRALAIAGAVLGVAAGLAAIVLQGATAGGTSAWQAFSPDVVHDVLATRFGSLMALRTAAFALILAALLAPRQRAIVAFAAMPLAVLVVAPALSGHAASQSPKGVLVPANVIHVAAMSIWVGGLVALVTALPRATRTLAPGDRTRLLSAVLTRFSTFALIAVAALLATGILQSLLHLESWSDLTDSAFGRAILVKTVLLAVLIAIGAYHRRRSLPALSAAERDGASPGAAGRGLRRALRAEVALVVVVLAVTGALTGYSPPSSAAAGPFSGSTDLGPARLDLTVDPARVGRNEMHLYLFGSQDGRPFDRAKELKVELRLPDKRIGPLPVRAEKSGPGHFTVPTASFGVTGDWRVSVSALVSEYEALDGTVEVKVR